MDADTTARTRRQGELTSQHGPVGGGGTADEPKDASADADALVEPAVALVRAWLDEAQHSLTRAERRSNERFRGFTGDARAVGFTMSFADRVVRPESSHVGATQLRELVDDALPSFLSPVDRAALQVGARIAPRLPQVVMPLAHRRLRQIVGPLIVDRDDRVLRGHLAELHREGFRVNVNLLGELVLGDDDAAKRRRGIVELLGRDDVHYLSVKASSVTSQLNLWAYDHTVERVKASLRELLQAAARSAPPKFVNLDMEEYKDLHLTLDAFTQLLDEPTFRDLEAGIVLQAYLPDSYDALRDLVAWADARRRSGGAGIKVRLVKGANLAMERVDAAMHGWRQAPYATKAETDANFHRLLDWLMRPERVATVRVGVASHNLFDVAWAKLLADARGVADQVEFEMLQGMAPGIARAVLRATGNLLLYMPVVPATEFDSALGYLFRRLEENSSGENFLRHLFDLTTDADAFATERARFEVAVADRWQVSVAPRRAHADSEPAPAAFRNQPDADPTDPAVRAVTLAALADPARAVLPDEVHDIARIDEVVAAAVTGARSWRSTTSGERQRLLRAAADELQVRRPQLVATMAHEAGKTIAEADGEVSEAVDFARYYADRIPGLDESDGASFAPLGVVAVVPPWNFPVAIPAGGVLAALAAGNGVILKPAPQTPRSAYAVAEACWAAGVPQDALLYVRCPDDEVGSRLVSHGDVDAIVLTGSYDTAELFRRLAPSTPLFAETSGKNAIVVMPDADLDLAVADLVRSAFGHAGQKCSAASLAICVGEVARSERFRRRLVDATRSLAVGPAARPEAVVGPLIGPPPAKLERALTTLGPGERWLLAPRLLDPDTNLWSPGIIEGVAPGSWFHQTECFGPVLGLMAAGDLDEALRLQNGVPFGLTGGIHSLDPQHVEEWLERVEVGNAYVNRAITGAIVQRQPFGGWKRSVVGPGAKAGGPSYVAQLGTWRDSGTPVEGDEPDPRVVALARSFAPALAAAPRQLLDAALRSDAFWWRTELTVEHDATGLFCESNVLRYRPLPGLVVRVAAGAAPYDVARVLAAATVVGVPWRVSVDPGYEGPLGRVEHRRETAHGFWAGAGERPPGRVRLLGREVRDAVLPTSVFVDDRPPVANGRIELLRYLREQSVSRTLHRFGNLVQSARA